MKNALTSVANYLANPINEILEEKKLVPVYEHAGLHMVLKKIIGNDKVLVKNSESKVVIMID